MGISPELQTDYPILFGSGRKKRGYDTPVRLPGNRRVGMPVFQCRGIQLAQYLSHKQMSDPAGESNSKVRVLLDGLSHQVVIFFTRTVHSRGAIDDIRKSRNTLQIKLRFKFTQPVSSIGHRESSSVIADKFSHEQGQTRSAY